LQIRDTNMVSYNVDTSPFRKIIVLARNTHDQELNCSFGIRGRGVAQWNGTAWDSGADDITLKANFDVYSVLNTHDSLQFLNLEGIKSLKINIQASVAPTNGVLDLIVWGVPN